MKKQETPSKPIGKHTIQTRVLLTWGEQKIFKRQRKTRNTIRKLMPHTCILLTGGEKRKNKKQQCKTQKSQKTPWTHYSPNMYTSHLGRKTTEQTTTMQNTKKPKGALETLITKHVYFTLGEKNENTLCKTGRKPRKPWKHYSPNMYTSHLGRKTKEQNNNNAKHKKAKRTSLKP